ncbi:MAG TPA: thiamine pyrophosphate-dependent enzyme, partial [Asticcacaulis sp.]
TGLAFADWYRNNGNVSFTYFGDGAANQGQVYESFNMAQLWKLPVVYVIENNEYAMGTALARASATTELYQRGLSFGIPGEQVDGMDVFAVKAAAEKAAEHARSGKGPYILEMKTYRYRGHSMSDPAKYRSKEEVDEVKTKRDPIDHIKTMLQQAGVAEDEIKALDNAVKAIVLEAVSFAQESPEPDPSELYTEVYLEA